MSVEQVTSSALEWIQDLYAHKVHSFEEFTDAVRRTGSMSVVAVVNRDVCDTIDPTIGIHGDYDYSVRFKMSVPKGRNILYDQPFLHQIYIGEAEKEKREKESALLEARTFMSAVDAFRTITNQVPSLKTRIKIGRTNVNLDRVESEILYSELETLGITPLPVPKDTSKMTE